MLREHEEAFESHIFDPAAASAYKENRHSLRMAATQGTLTSEQNIFGNIAQLAERFEPLCSRSLQNLSQNKMAP